LDDAGFDVESELAQDIAEAFSELEGAAFITGSGVGRPKGITQYDTIANTSWAWGKLGFIVTGNASNFAASNPADPLITLVYSLKSVYRQNASWVMNSTVAGTIRKFKDGQGNYLWQPSTILGQPDMLLGYPVFTDDNMPDVGSNTFPVAFGDFQRGYTIIDRLGLRVLRDPYTNKPFVNFYTIKRVGGGVANYEAIKLLKCST